LSQKFNPKKAGNLLKVNTVTLFSPNIHENKCGYAPIWPHADAAVIALAAASPDLGPPWAVAPPHPEGLLAVRTSPSRPMHSSYYLRSPLVVFRALIVRPQGAADGIGDCKFKIQNLGSKRGQWGQKGGGKKGSGTCEEIEFGPVINSVKH